MRWRTDGRRVSPALTAVGRRGRSLRTEHGRWAGEGRRRGVRRIAAGACCLGAAWGWLATGAGPVAWAAAPPRAAEAVEPRPGQADALAAGAFTAPQAERGRAVYQEHCQSCHGSSLRGGANEFAAPALAGPFFFDAWGGRPVAELLAYSAENMPPEGSLLPEPDYVDVTAYILQVLGYPEGDTALTADSAALADPIERQR